MFADVFRARARTFWFAARFLPADRRHAAAGLYAFARAVDYDVFTRRAATSTRFKAAEAVRCAFFVRLPTRSSTQAFRRDSFSRSVALPAGAATSDLVPLVRS